MRSASKLNQECQIRNRCGPCKVMLPLLEDLAQDLKGKADIVKFNCNAKNKELGKKLNVRVAPTFHIYKSSNKVRILAYPQDVFLMPHHP